MVGEVVSVGASADEGMCGVRFEERARWLIVAYATGGMLETNGCLPNGPMDEAPPKFQATVTASCFHSRPRSLPSKPRARALPLVLAFRRSSSLASAWASRSPQGIDCIT